MALSSPPSPPSSLPSSIRCAAFPGLRQACLGIGLLSGLLVAQGPRTGPFDAPKGLTVWFLDVGQGDSTLVRGPTGKTLLMDGGKNGEGTRVVLPLLKSLGIRHIDYMVSSHFHPDHLGGLDEVLAKVSVGQVWDRGTWMVPSYPDYKRYMTASARLRKAVTLGQKLDLGGGAFAQVMAANGKVLGGKTVTIKGRYQAENAASVVLKVEYGDFDLFLGGDLTGGGNKTPDVESVVAPLFGEVEVYKLSHHGSSTSSNATFMRILDPEVSIASAGYKNPYRHPSTRTLNRFNTRTGSRLIVGTTPGAGWAGFTNMGTIRLQSDGWRYRVETLQGEGMDFYVDEHPGSAPGPGDLIISEVQRLTRATEGEYLELYNRAGHPLNLDGLVISGRAGSVKIPVSYRLAPGGRFLFFRHGDVAKNGGLPFGHCWPYRAFSIGDSSDTLKISLGNRQLDLLSYGSSFAGGKGVAAERRDLELLPTTASNFVASTTTYGRAGDRGSPGAKYAGDKTLYPLRAGAEVLNAQAAGGKALHLFGTAFSDPGRFHVMAMSLGNSPGLSLGKVHLELNLDSLLLLSVGLPGFTAMLPSAGLRGVRMPLPSDPGLSRTQIWFAHFLMDPLKAPFFPKASKSISIILP